MYNVRDWLFMIVTSAVIYSLMHHNFVYDESDEDIIDTMKLIMTVQHDFL